MEQSLTTTQEQLSQRVSEVVKLEQTVRKLQTELKTMRERCASYEDEIHDQKDTIGQWQICGTKTSQFKYRRDIPPGQVVPVLPKPIIVS